MRRPTTSKKKLREKWRHKAQTAKGSMSLKKITPEEAYESLASLIAEGDYGGVRGVLRDTCEDAGVYQVLLGYASIEGSAPPLLLAAEAGRLDVVEALMEAGANARAVDSKGRTASQVAEAGGHKELSKMLITWAATQS